jgi:putative glycosyltransferase (TIGR04372 family)
VSLALSCSSFVRRQRREINQGGWPIVWRKVKRALRSLILLPAGLLFVLLMRLLRPWFLIRINPLASDRIGHFAGNTELYLCERTAGINAPKRPYVDLCYFAATPVANEQLAVMWARRLRIWPAWLLGQAFRLNRLLPGAAIHEVGDNTQGDRDVHNLFERMPPFLSFTPEEKLRGQAGLAAMGIPTDGEFICLVARDDAYLKTLSPQRPGHFDYHNYRNVDIQNFVAAAEALADLGYYVIRMGSAVKALINSTHPRVIDYAANNMRSDFMDIYLGATCSFCVSSGAGLDAIPRIFRRPMAFASLLPIGYLLTFEKDSVGICKKHWLTSEQRWLSLKEIFNLGVGYCLASSGYDVKGVEVVENTPKEIRSLVMEMAERIKGTWLGTPDDEALQRRFWEIYPIDARDARGKAPLHGQVRARYGAQFLRDNRDWLQ